MGEFVRLAVVIPAYGRRGQTQSAARSVLLEAELVDPWIVDNKGDYVPVDGEHVIAPGRNVGWLEGCNRGLLAAADADYDGFVLLNNDVDLSTGFFGCLAEALGTGATLIGPTYDGFWAHQHSNRSRRSSRMWEVPFIDGTCMLIWRSLFETIGPLDTDFRQFGWGGELDYCIRARAAGHRIVVTDRAYLHHHNEGTAIDVHGAGYGHDARRVMYELMDQKHGEGWDTRLGIGEASHNTTRLSTLERFRQTRRIRRWRS